MKEYMKSNNPKGAKPRIGLKSTFMTSDHRIDIEERTYFEFDTLLIIFNCAVHYGGFDNVALISSYTASLLKRYHGLVIQLKLDKYDTIDRDETLKQILRSVAKDVWSTLLQKRLIVYIDNANGNHWNCVFILNLRNYIICQENEKKKEDEKLPVNDEISGYFYYDPISLSTSYKRVHQRKGVIELLSIIYDYCWNRTKPEKDQSDDNPFHN